MKLGIGLPNTMAHETDRRLMLEWARLADEAGFELLGTIDDTASSSADRPSGRRAMSKPAENPRPAPVRMIARTSASASASSRAVWTSAVICGLMALMVSGRLSVRVTTGPAFSYRIIS